MGPKRSIYSNRTVKCSIKGVTTYILPWAPQALSAALPATYSFPGLTLTMLYQIVCFDNWYV